MRRFPLLPAVFVAVALCGSMVGPSAEAQDGAAAPTYSRMRMGADDWNARGGRWVPGGYGGYGGYGYFPPYVSPVVAGTWYARPYPYHFDYYRMRWGGAEQAPPGDCPCDAGAVAAPPAEPAP